MNKATPAAFLARKERELGLKLSSLPLELQAWRARALSSQSLEKNHSQIVRLTEMVEGLQALVEAGLKEASKKQEVMRSAASLQQRALAVQTVWDLFRSKLALRLVPPFDSFLALADAFARECYLPAFKRRAQIAEDTLCPAPLVTFDAHLSPWAQVEKTTGGEEGSVISGQQFQQALDQLPLTLLGIPWIYLSYLPHTALLAHEAAHALEHSAWLGASLDLAILNTNLADPDRRPAWQSWRKEVFADLYACQTAGPAYVWALADQLAREHAQIAKENRPLQNGEWTNYPTKALRVHFCCKALELSGFVSEGQELQQQWTQSYPEHLLLKFLEDAEEVIKRLTDVLNLADIPTAIFTREMMNGASALARRCRAGALLAKDEPRSARVYVTAAWLIAGPNEGSAELSRHWNTLAQHHLVSRPAGLAGNAPSPASDAAETTQAAIDRIAAILFVDL